MCRPHLVSNVLRSHPVSLIAASGIEVVDRRAQTLKRVVHQRPPSPNSVFTVSISHSAMGRHHHPDASLLFGASAVPIDDVNQLPGILAELELKLTLFVDNQLGSGVKHSA